MTAADHEKSAMQSLHRLRHIAEFQGDPEAVKALRDIGLWVAEVLEDLTLWPDADEIPEVIKDGVAIAKQVAKESIQWPVAYHAIPTIRKKVLSRTDKLNVGSALGIKLSGKGLNYSHGTQTGFARRIFHKLEKIRLNPASHFHATKLFPILLEEGMLLETQKKKSWKNLAAELLPLSRESCEQWETAGLELCLDDTDNFPWPECVYSMAGAMTDGNGHQRTAVSALKTKIKEGFKSLIIMDRME